MGKTPPYKKLYSGLDPLAPFHVKKAASRGNHGLDPGNGLVKTIIFFIDELPKKP
jgi:hypothetical protein